MSFLRGAWNLTSCAARKNVTTQKRVTFMGGEGINFLNAPYLSYVQILKGFAILCNLLQLHTELSAMVSCCSKEMRIFYFISCEILFVSVMSLFLRLRLSDMKLQDDDLSSSAYTHISVNTSLKHQSQSKRDPDLHRNYQSSKKNIHLNLGIPASLSSLEFIKQVTRT